VRSGGPRAWLIRGALALATALLVVTLVSQWNEVSTSIRSLTAVGLTGSALFTVLAVGLTVLSWRAVLAGLGAHLPLRAATRIFFVGQVGKYIPGSVWPVLAQMELSRDYGVSRPRSAAASLIVLALAVPCGGFAAASTLPFVSRDALANYWWALIAVPAFAVLLWPPVLTRLLGVAFRLLRRPALEDPLTLRPLLAGAGWLLVSFACYGVATFLLARDLGASIAGPRLLALAVGGYALAWTAGFLVLVVPAGAGVREAVLALALSPALASGPAIVLALVARLLATLADLVWAAVGLALRPRGPRVGAPDDLAHAAENGRVQDAGAVDRGPVDRGPVDRGPVDRRAADRGAADRGAADRCAGTAGGVSAGGVSAMGRSGMGGGAGDAGSGGAGGAAGAGNAVGRDPVGRDPVGRDVAVPSTAGHRSRPTAGHRSRRPAPD
jgi:hypothetical protein